MIPNVWVYLVFSVFAKTNIQFIVYHMPCQALCPDALINSKIQHL